MISKKSQKTKGPQTKKPLKQKAKPKEHSKKGKNQKIRKPHQGRWMPVCPNPEGSARASKGEAAEDIHKELYTKNTYKIFGPEEGSARAKTDYGQFSEQAPGVSEGARTVAESILAGISADPADHPATRSRGRARGTFSASTFARAPQYGSNRESRLGVVRHEKRKRRSPYR